MGDIFDGIWLDDLVEESKKKAHYTQATNIS